ncbi:bifunctional adenosylcobinamide kinase/adenosylcobinamide-phosphate guanylyltransferase [Dictyobacter aurantiacus]|uniref:Adenosylcobinamide kinase n=1 Tax=Dictyobacter aurantiacus TaxID=1936993 RepID=A0A401Z917_9CHLR|nr:bifunctional adenosylcobinamide kinase/adenosylcobinamide-phosphate guanylyltransferase [Dictyobacter aurantiacus]GCE03342.1 adenosylcobinamide kinase/adenosylcobinamide phosphate guanyltransferase [Dictyobacter aurantiacus]
MTDRNADIDEGPGLVLLLGGARSGKSTFAERLATKSGRSVAFIATAIAIDEDMRDRIARHQSSRPADWRTIEEPLHLAAALRQAAAAADVVILDCLTVWLSNWLFSQDNSAQLENDNTISARHYAGALQEIDALLQAVSELEPGKTLVVVSNEVGLGIVPAYALGRIYRDVLGLVNQRIAAAATRVYLMVAGLGVDIKRLDEAATL